MIIFCDCAGFSTLRFELVRAKKMFEGFPIISPKFRNQLRHLFVRHGIRAIPAGCARYLWHGFILQLRGFVSAVIDKNPASPAEGATSICWGRLSMADPAKNVRHLHARQMKKACPIDDRSFCYGAIHALYSRFAVIDTNWIASPVHRGTHEERQVSWPPFVPHGVNRQHFIMTHLSASVYLAGRLAKKSVPLTRCVPARMPCTFPDTTFP